MEEWLFFRQYAFHRQKLIFHRASMQAYADRLREKGYDVVYIDAQSPLSDIRLLVGELAREGVERLLFYEPSDDWLLQHIEQAVRQHGLQLDIRDSPLFLNTTGEIDQWFAGRKRLFQTDFYVHERKRRKLLLDKEGKPLQGKWSLDADNRQRFPKGQKPPLFSGAKETAYHREAIAYVAKHFPSNPGHTAGSWHYPVTHEAAAQWLEEFLHHRLAAFGPYEDAMVPGESVLHHAVITPMLNVGLLTPDQVLQQVLDRAEQQEIPYNSLEGFVRQIIGWREFIRGVYRHSGRAQRSKNFWSFTRPVPSRWYSGETGILPVDDCIQRLLKTGYNHHIERLMILGSFMLLCEMHPDAVYQWFMEMYIDAYDWVMVPNVYGMSQYADGGKMCTKPYISGSNYILKMSQWKADGVWNEVWDALFWRFMDIHRQVFLSNPRLGLLVNSFDRMPEEKRRGYHQRAEAFIQKLYA